jgi:hypothetical protein
MELDKKDAAVVTNAIRFWEENNKISAEQADELRSSVRIRNSNIDAVAVYALISAISCGLLAFASLVIDEKWIELLRKEWGFSETVVGIAFTLLALFFVVLARRRKLKNINAIASSETYNITIALTVGIAITYWTRSFANFDGNYALPLLLAAISYGVVAVFLESRLLWLAMIISLAGWWGAQTHFWSGGSYRFAGMNYPLRMTLFGLVLWCSSILVNKMQSLHLFKESTYQTGLLLFLTAAWTLSIFGNYDNLEAWTIIKQGHFWYWALGFTLVLVGMIAYAIKTGNDVLRDMSLIFFLLNIYTRYFEYFWDRTNKGIFFAVLALSFWLLGRKAEQWRSKEKKKI